MRMLRTYQRMAYIHHWCDYCCTHIEPRSFYEGCVMLYENKKKYKVSVFKKHIEPSCPRDLHDLSEEVIESSKEKFQPLETKLLKAA